MADHSKIRYPKSGCCWTEKELQKYRFTFVHCTGLEFFGTETLPDPSLPLNSEFLVKQSGLEMQSTDDAALANALRFATTRTEEGHVDDFAVSLLTSLGYACQTRYVGIRKELPVTMCGELKLAKADVYVMDLTKNTILLLVQANTRIYNQGRNSLAQLIAEAIAAFQFNNWQRNQAGLPMQEEMLIPAIYLRGSYPTFYLVPVTQQLSKAVVQGNHPSIETHVKVYVPQVPRMAARMEEGMWPLDNRRIILKCYEAFKQFVY
ncbi:hypothetical protein JB92DRAFT_2789678 [Gautieria morchelliformis]|nr:hypothetical protein JB92DRAFT_2789678 [Gautieria morchelliformis]